MFRFWRWVQSASCDSQKMRYICQLAQMGAFTNTIQQFEGRWYFFLDFLCRGVYPQSQRWVARQVKRSLIDESGWARDTPTGTVTNTGPAMQYKTQNTKCKTEPSKFKKRNLSWGYLAFRQRGTIPGALLTWASNEKSIWSSSMNHLLSEVFVRQSPHSGICI